MQATSGWDNTRVTAVAPGSGPSRALTLLGEEIGKCQALPPSPWSLPSHSIPRKGNRGGGAGQESHRTPTSASRGPGLPRGTMGYTHLSFSQVRAGAARKTAWSPLTVLCSDAPDLISCWECSSLIHSSTFVWCFFFCCVKYRSQVTWGRELSRTV